MRTRSRLCLMLFIVSQAFFQNAGAEKLYVFCPSLVRPHLVQKELSEHMPGIDVTVFGLRDDFENLFKANPPDAVLAKAPFAKTLAGYNQALTGLLAGKAEENYVLLSVDKDYPADQLPGKTIGVVDILDKKEMEAFVSGLLTAPVKLKRVKKIEDLLPLLTFRMADAILIPESQIAYFKGTSNLTFKLLRLPSARADIASLAVKISGTAPLTLKWTRALPSDIKTMIGVDEWK